METKIDGLYIEVNDFNITIHNSYKISNKQKIENLLQNLFVKIEKNIDCNYKTKRTLNSFINEWIAHNRLYKMHLFRKRTKDVDLEAKQNIIMKFIYFILSK